MSQLTMGSMTESSLGQSALHQTGGTKGTPIVTLLHPDIPTKMHLFNVCKQQQQQQPQQQPQQPSYDTSSQSTTIIPLSLPSLTLPISSLTLPIINHPTFQALPSTVLLRCWCPTKTLSRSLVQVEPQTLTPSPSSLMRCIDNNNSYHHYQQQHNTSIHPSIYTLCYTLYPPYIPPLTPTY